MNSINKNQRTPSREPLLPLVSYGAFLHTVSVLIMALVSISIVFTLSYLDSTLKDFTQSLQFNLFLISLYSFLPLALPTSLITWFICAKSIQNNSVNLLAKRGVIVQMISISFPLIPLLFSMVSLVFADKIQGYVCFSLLLKMFLGLIIFYIGVRRSLKATLHRYKEVVC